MTQFLVWKDGLDAAGEFARRDVLQLFYDAVLAPEKDREQKEIDTLRKFLAGDIAT